MLAVLAGSFFGLRTGTKPAPSRYASAGAKINPRASMPATMSIAWPVDERVKSALVFQQRRKVIEKNSRLRIVRHFADQFLQVIHSPVLLVLRAFEGCSLAVSAAGTRRFRTWPQSSARMNHKSALVLCLDRRRLF